MSNGTISDELKGFIHRNINSVEQLEVLLLLFQEPARVWTPQEIAQRLYSQPESVAMRLADLCDKNLCLLGDRNSQQYQYRSGDALQDRLVADLRRAYEVRRVTVINLIFFQPGDPISIFSDAFRLRRDD